MRNVFLIFLAGALFYYFSYPEKTAHEILEEMKVKNERKEALTKQLNPKTTYLREIVKVLTEVNPARNHANINSLNKIADFIKKEFGGANLQTKFQPYQVNGKTYKNVRALLGDTKKPRIVIGAHYDVAGDYPGADDNASGVAVMLQVSKNLKNLKLKNISIEFVAFTLEEPPYFRTKFMGSNIHAQSLIDEDIQVWGLLNLEMVGFYSDKPNSQSYPIPGMSLIYPDKGNFIAVIGNTTNNEMVQMVEDTIASEGSLPVVSLVAPEQMKGVDFSDHLNYWERGLPAVMLTDSAFYRNKHYHTQYDTIEKLDFVKMKLLSDIISKGIISFDSRLDN